MPSSWRSRRASSPSRGGSSAGERAKGSRLAGGASRCWSLRSSLTHLWVRSLRFSAPPRASLGTALPAPSGLEACPFVGSQVAHAEQVEAILEPIDRDRHDIAAPGLGRDPDLVLHDGFAAYGVRRVAVGHIAELLGDSRRRGIALEIARLGDPSAQ